MDLARQCDFGSAVMVPMACLQGVCLVVSSNLPFGIRDHGLADEALSLQDLWLDGKGGVVKCREGQGRADRRHWHRPVVKKCQVVLWLDGGPMG
jgi:hypothetical protein